MAKVEFTAAIDMLKGAIDSSHKLIMRQKHLHDTRGVITKECDPEAYYQEHKRDYKHNPPQGAELAHLQHFGEAAKRTTAIVRAFKNPDTATEEERQLVQHYIGRFQAQLAGTPDSQAPTDKEGKQKIYSRFDNFVRAMIYQELQAAQ